METVHKGRFVRHFLEMVVAMLVGMAVLGAARMGVVAVAGLEYSSAQYPELEALLMAFDMSVGMVVWMRYRGHGWAGTLEMAGVMSAPAVALAPLGWAGVISGDSLMIVTHVAMVPLMLAALLRRRSEYAR